MASRAATLYAMQCMIVNPNQRTALCYSWDSDQHKAWVKELATRLRSDGVDVLLDQWELNRGDRLPKFMESLVRDSRYVLVIGTPGYKARFDNRTGGAGYEGHIIAAEVLDQRSGDKFIPVLRSGDWTTSLPTAMASVLGVDLRGNPYVEEQYHILVKTLYAVKNDVPPVGSPPSWLNDLVIPSPPVGFVEAASENSQMNPTRNSKYRRKITMRPTKEMRRLPAQYWHAAEEAFAGCTGPWPLSIYWYKEIGRDDQFVSRQILDGGFTIRYEQEDNLIYREEEVTCKESAEIVISETQEFPNRHPEGFPYDTAIATVFDALSFGEAFFRALGAVDSDEVTVSIHWEGLKGRFITADTCSILPSYHTKRSQNDFYGKTAKCSLAELTPRTSELTRNLVGGLLNQFDMFDPALSVYEQILTHWRSLNT